MHKQSRDEPIGGSAVHIDDCYVWAAISYLDSPTDYREYLPHDRLELPAASDSELMMLEARSHTLWPALRIVAITAFLICTFLLLSGRVCG